MKKLNLLGLGVVLLSATLLFSCGGDDDGGSGSPAPNPNPGENESNPIELSVIETGVSIDGADQVEGDPPAPNSNIDFGVPSNEQNGFQSTGFNIAFTSSEQVDGAYVTFMDSDYNKTRSYFNIPASSFGRKGLFDRKVHSKLDNGKVMTEEYDINVNFSSDIPVGTFCYEICIYDANGNISQPEVVCVTVKNWGGNTTIAGDWVFDRYEPAGFETDTDTIPCDAGGFVIVDYSQLDNENWNFTLNVDGTYYEEYDGQEKFLDETATRAQCQPVFTDGDVYNDRYEGNWSFDQTKQELTVVDFKYINILDPTQNEDYPEGELYFEGIKAEVINNELVLSEEDPDTGELGSAIFRRK
jgi:hypothetical protein